MSKPDRAGKEDKSVRAFVARWKASGGAERANYTLFLTKLYGILGLEPPHPSSNDPDCDDYVFERAVTFHHPDGTTSTDRIDLYKRNAFALEAKQGVEAEPVGQFDPLPPSDDKPREKFTAVCGKAKE